MNWLAEIILAVDRYNADRPAGWSENSRPKQKLYTQGPLRLNTATSQLVTLGHVDAHISFVFKREAAFGQVNIGCVLKLTDIVA